MSNLLDQLESKFTKGESRTVDKKPWTKEQVALLIVLYSQDVPRKTIAELTTHPELSVTYKIGAVKKLKTEKGLPAMLLHFKLTMDDLKQVIEVLKAS